MRPVVYRCGWVHNLAGQGNLACLGTVSERIERNILLSNGQPFLSGGYWGFFHLRNYPRDNRSEAYRTAVDDRAAVKVVVTNAARKN
ncbi:MAG: hypothetical protein O3B24_04790 [Verrucomicrobia bacterium]|nr:hypothetical protein [Verrucomicrobiota bacterium]